MQEQARKRSGGSFSGGGKTGKAYYVGNFQVSAFLMDKQVEAIEVVRLALQIDDGRRSNSQKKESAESADGHTAVLSLNASTLRYSTDKGEFEVKTFKTLNMQKTQSPNSDKWSLRVFNGGQCKQSLDRKSGEKSFANVFENSYELLANISSQNEGQITIQLKSSGDLNGLVGKNSFKENFELAVNLTVDRESLEKNEIAILSAASELSFKKPDGKIFKTILEGRDLKLLASGNCNTLLGTALIKSDKTGKKISATEDGLVISGTDYKFGLATCGKRPTIDLSRLLP